MNILAGNNRICERVLSMLSSGRIPHALLIDGENGTGRHTLARYIASFCVCTGEEKPCGRCQGCHLSQVLSHPDISVISPDAKQLTVNKIRDLRQDAFMAPALADRKVYIIEKTESMNAAAQNALLKILEEPPESVVFILICQNAQTLLETVRSRCITLSLLPPNHAEAQGYIEEHTSFSALEIDRALQSVNNNIGQALTLLNENKQNTLSVLASELIFDIKSSDSYSMLCRLKPYENNRGAVLDLFDELLLKISSLLKESCYTHIKEGLSKDQLVRLYEITRSLRENAENNANLMLLFANLCSEYKAASMDLRGF